MTKSDNVSDKRRTARTQKIQEFCQAQSMPLMSWANTTDEIELSDEQVSKQIRELRVHINRVQKYKLDTITEIRHEIVEIAKLMHKENPTKIQSISREVAKFGVVDGAAIGLCGVGFIGAVGSVK